MRILTKTVLAGILLTMSAYASSGELTISIRTLKDNVVKDTELTVTTKDTIQQILAKLNGDSSDQRRLCYCGTLLDNTHTLGSYNIKNGHLIHLIEGGYWIRVMDSTRHAIGLGVEPTVDVGKVKSQIIAEGSLLKGRIDGNGIRLLHYSSKLRNEGTLDQYNITEGETLYAAPAKSNPQNGFWIFAELTADETVGVFVASDDAIANLKWKIKQTLEREVTSLFLDGKPVLNVSQLKEGVTISVSAEGSGSIKKFGLYAVLFVVVIGSLIFCIINKDDNTDKKDEDVEAQNQPADE